MKSEALIGLDIGTTGIKVIGFSLDGQELAKAIEPTPTRHLANGWFEHDPHELWDSCRRALTSVSSALLEIEAQPVALCCTSMSEAGVLLDGGGEPCYPVIPWFDFRTQPQIDWWAETVGRDETAAICGVVLHPMFGMPKLMWIRDNEPDAYDTGRVWLNLADYANYRLCGSVSTDFSLASRTMVLDLARSEWSNELLDAIGVRRSLLAELVGAGTVVGTLDTDSAQQVGLPQGLPVVRGGQDHVCAAMALGVTEPGVILDSIGTAEAFFAARSQPDMTGRLWPDELNQGVHVVPGFTYVMTGTGDGGGRIDRHRVELGVDFDAYLDAAAQPGAERDMIESLAQDGQRLFERMVWACETDAVRHIATGGGTRIPLLMDRKRSIGRRDIEVPDVAEATCWGAALLAGVGIGAYSAHASAPSEAIARRR